MNANANANKEQLDTTYLDSCETPDGAHPAPQALYNAPSWPLSNAEVESYCRSSWPRSSLQKAEADVARR